jgi:putative membrane protein
VRRIGVKNILLVIKGFIMGIANIIPGVSGGTLALTLGIYEDFIGAISHFFRNIKKHVNFLLPIFVGILLSVITMSNVISTCFDQYPIPTTLFFMGLVIGGIPMLLKRVKNTKEKKQVSSYVIALITFSIVMIMAFSEQIFGSGLGNVSFSNMAVFDYVILFFVGLIAAATMVIPGVSGSLVLMLLGYYLPIIGVLKELTKFENLGPNLLVAFVFGVGVLVGIVAISKVIEYLLEKFEAKTFFGVIGFILASIIAIPVSVYHEVGTIVFSVPQGILGVLFLAIGIIVGYKLGEK